MDNDKVGQVPPDNTEGLRERAEAAVEDWFNHLTDDDEPTIEQIGRGVAAAVLTALAGDPGDLPTRMRDAILDMPNPKLSIGDDDTHRHHRYAAGCPVCKGDVEAIAAAAMSVRWEYAARQAAEVERLRTALAATRSDVDAMQREVHRHVLANAEAQGEVERLRAERAEAERDLLRETLAESDLGAQVLAQWEAIAAADADRDRLEAERDSLVAAARKALEIRQTHHKTDHAHRLLDPNCTVCQMGLVLSRDMPSRPDDPEKIRCLAQATTEETNDG